MGHCPDCRFAFCRVCNKTYHGVDACDFIKMEQEAERQRRFMETQLAILREKEVSSSKNLPEDMAELNAVFKWWKYIFKKDNVEGFLKRCPGCGTGIQVWAREALESFRKPVDATTCTA